MRLLLVEDDRMLARGIAAALAQRDYTVDIVATAKDALHIVRDTNYEIGILDLGLPDRDGLELLRAWRGAGIVFPILILSARTNLDDRIRGLDSGADDYLIKPFALSEIEARLRALLRRPTHRQSRHQLGQLRFDVAGQRVTVGDRTIDLTKRELDLLGMLISRAGRVVRKQDLLDALFPSDADVGTNALEVHVSRLRQKLRHAAVTIRALRGLGYRIEETTDGDDEKP